MKKTKKQVCCCFMGQWSRCCFTLPKVTSRLLIVVCEETGGEILPEKLMIKLAFVSCSTL